MGRRKGQKNSYLSPIVMVARATIKRLEKQLKKAEEKVVALRDRLKQEKELLDILEKKHIKQVEKV